MSQILGIVAVPVFLGGGLILWIIGASILRNAEPKHPKPIPKNELRECRACGALYHESWGSICANCSGAD